MNDEQLLFWLTEGRSCSTTRKRGNGEDAVEWDRSLSLAENVARIKEANEKWRASRGKDR